MVANEHTGASKQLVEDELVVLKDPQRPQALGQRSCVSGSRQSSLVVNEQIGASKQVVVSVRVQVIGVDVEDTVILLSVVRDTDEEIEVEVIVLDVKMSP